MGKKVPNGDLHLSGTTESQQKTWGHYKFRCAIIERNCSMLSLRVRTTSVAETV